MILRFLIIFLIVSASGFVYADKALPPVLLSPVDGTKNLVKNNIKFTWNKSSDEKAAKVFGYRILISENSRFSGYNASELACDDSCIVETITNSESSYTTSLKSEREMFFWKVQATSVNSGAVIGGKWSKISSFKTPPKPIIIPSITTISAEPQAIVQGESLLFSAILSSKLSRNYSVKINYGNGLVAMSGTDTQFESSLKPNTVGTQSYSIGVYDNKDVLKNRLVSGTFEIIAPNTPPTLELNSGEVSAITNTDYVVKLYAGDIDNNLNRVTIDWGDGATNSKAVSNGSATISFSHIYTANGSYTWKATAYDLDNASSDIVSKTVVAKESVVVIPTVPKVLKAFAEPSSVALNNSIKFSATLSANLLDSYSVKVNYGNGLVQMIGYGTSYSVTQILEKLGVQTFSVGIYDTKNVLKSNTIKGDFEVFKPAPINDAPSLSLISADTVSDTDTVYIVQLQAKDKNNNLSHVVINWGDNTSDTQNANNNDTLSFSHTYASIGDYSWSVIAYDNDEATSANLSKTVSISKPIVKIAVPNVINAVATPNSVAQGKSVTFSASLSSNLPDTYSVKANFDNGLVSMSGSGTNYTVTQIPSKLGTQTFSVGVYDSINTLKSNSITGNFEITQSAPVNVAPTLSFISGNTSATTNASYSVQLQATDLDNNLSSIVIDWGDGASDSQAATNSSRLTFSHIFTTEKTYNWSATASDSGALKSNTISKNVAVSNPAPIVVTPPETTTKTTGYTKIANNGSALSDDAKLGTAPTDWACTKDNKTGLIWEVKTDDGGLRDKDWYYNWYEPDASKNGGFEGYTNSEFVKCSISDNCNTYAFTNTVNKQSLCGATDWRMPTNEELKGLVYCSDGKYNKLEEGDSGAICSSNGNDVWDKNGIKTTSPTIDTTYFPDIKKDDNYWFFSSTVANDGSNAVWVVYFATGGSYNVGKMLFFPIRLVRNLNSGTVVANPTPATTKTIGYKTTGYSKIANNGSVLSDSAILGSNSNDWACTKDNKTGLIWEIKTDDGGWRDKDWVYSWYEPDESKNGGDAGYQNHYSTGCKGSDCDTYTFISTVNIQNLCGKNDWRLPTKDELITLVFCSDGKYNTQAEDEAGYICTNYSLVTSPTINVTYFPNTQEDWFWTSSLYPYNSISLNIWRVNFDYGNSKDYYKYNFKYVRLVR